VTLHFAPQPRRAGAVLGMTSGLRRRLLVLLLVPLLLLALINAPKPASKDKLLQALTGWDKEITPNAVEVYISRLRSKLEPYGVALRSIRGFGYRLELRPAETPAE